MPALLCCLLPDTSGAQQQVRYSREVFPASIPVEHGDEKWLAFRAVDGVTGRPVAGAEVLLVPERMTPLPGELWSTRRAVGDADGFVRVRIDDIEEQRSVPARTPREWSWVVVRAAGYGPSTKHEGIDDLVWPLMPAQDVPVRVLDWQGRPVGGALLGFCGGCGHTPDLANAASGPDGVALLRAVDPHNHLRDLYVQHPGLHLTGEVLEWHPGDPPFELWCEPSVATTGRIVDHEGAPVAGAFVGTRERHRGPWAKTGGDGAFRLLGAGPGERTLIAVLPGREVFFERPASFPAVLRVPPPDGEPAQDGTVECAPAPEPQDVPPVAVQVRLSADHAREEPRVRLRWFGDERDVTDLVAAGEDVEVPGAGPFCFVMFAEDDHRFFPFAGASEMPEGKLKLRWYAPTLVTGSVVDEEGKPVSVRAGVGRWTRRPEAPDADVPCPDGRLALRAHHAGLSLVRLEPDREDLRPRLVWASLPPRADEARVRLGTVQLSATPALCVLDTDGSPLEGASVTFSRSGCHRAGEPPAFPLDDDGGWLGPDLQAGDAVAVTAPAGDGDMLVPFRTVLQGDGPWTIRLPATALDVKVTGEDGAPLQAVLFAADRAFLADGKLRLLHLPPGEHELFVAAQGFQTAKATVTVPAQGRSELRLVLPKH